MLGFFDFSMHTYFFDGKIVEQLVLNDVESNHAVKVMRSKEGTLVRIINGKGEVGIGEIKLAHPKKCEINITDVKVESFQGNKVTIAIAPTKVNDRIEFFVEKATEIGVYQIIPLICKNNERDKVNIERWQKVALAATKQSHRTWLPQISNAMKIDEVIKMSNFQSKLIAYCEDLPEKSIRDFSGQNNLLILIGPEGDFTVSEVSAAMTNGFNKVNLGTNRLRTETAGIVAVCNLI